MGLICLLTKRKRKFLVGFSEYINLLPKTRVIKVPDGIGNKEAVMIEVLASALRGVQRGYLHGDLATHQKVAVVGVGPIGLSATAMFYGSGSDVIAIDRIENRLETAKDFGATHTINIANLSIDELVGMVADLTGGVGVDVAMECAGEPYAFNEALSIIRRGGRLIEMGNFAYVGDAHIDLTKICQMDIEIIGSAETLYRDFITAKKFITSKKFNFEKLITKVLPLDNIKDGIESVINRIGIKSVVDPNE